MKIIRDYGPGLVVAFLSVAALCAAVQPQGVKAKDVSSDVNLQQIPKLKTTLKPKAVPHKRKPLKKSKPVALDYHQFPSRVVLATGYTAGIESTGKTPKDPTYGITYSGVRVSRGKYSTIAADPSVYPIGTLLYIPGYGYGIVADTGSKIKGNRIDLYFKTVHDVYSQWGRKKLKVYLIHKGNGHLSKKAKEELKAS